MPNTNSLTGKRRNDKPKPKLRKPVVADTTCTPCSGMGNGLMFCFDGAVQVLTPPSEGTWAPVYTAGVGWTWVNAGTFTDRRLSPVPVPEIPPTKDGRPHGLSYRLD